MPVGDFTHGCPMKNNLLYQPSSKALGSTVALDYSAMPYSKGKGAHFKVINSEYQCV